MTRAALTTPVSYPTSTVETTQLTTITQRSNPCPCHRCRQSLKPPPPLPLWMTRNHMNRATFMPWMLECTYLLRMTRVLALKIPPWLRVVVNTNRISLNENDRRRRSQSKGSCRQENRQQGDYFCLSLAISSIQRNVRENKSIDAVNIRCE